MDLFSHVIVNVVVVFSSRGRVRVHNIILYQFFKNSGGTVSLLSELLMCVRTLPTGRIMR